MAEIKHPRRLLWVDLEMTGLNPEKQRIIEVAVIATDFDLKEIARYESIIHHGEEVLVGAEDWTKENLPGLLEEVRTAKKDEQQVVGELLQFIEEHFPDERPILAGNSIHQDRRFVRKWWPKIDARLHYRMLDVSSFKIWIQGSQGKQMSKGEKHRALEDIEESISELKWCLGQMVDVRQVDAG